MKVKLGKAKSEAEGSRGFRRNFEFSWKSKQLGTQSFGKQPMVRNTSSLGSSSGLGQHAEHIMRYSCLSTVLAFWLCTPYVYTVNMMCKLFMWLCINHKISQPVWPCCSNQIWALHQVGAESSTGCLCVDAKWVLEQTLWVLDSILQLNFFRECQNTWKSSESHFSFSQKNELSLSVCTR